MIELGLIGQTMLTVCKRTSDEGHYMAMYITELGAVDVLIELPGVGPFDVLARSARRYDLPGTGVKIYVAGLEDIIRSEENAGRTRDIAPDRVVRGCCTARRTARQLRPRPQRSRRLQTAANRLTVHRYRLARPDVPFPDASHPLAAVMGVDAG
jgi:hypothetical protein